MGVKFFLLEDSAPLAVDHVASSVDEVATHIHLLSLLVPVLAAARVFLLDSVPSRLVSKQVTADVEELKCLSLVIEHLREGAILPEEALVKDDFALLADDVALLVEEETLMVDRLLVVIHHVIRLLRLALEVAGDLERSKVEPFDACGDGQVAISRQLHSAEHQLAVFVDDVPTLVQKVSLRTHGLSFRVDVAAVWSFLQVGWHALVVPLNIAHDVALVEVPLLCHLHSSAWPPLQVFLVL